MKKIINNGVMISVALSMMISSGLSSLVKADTYNTEYKMQKTGNGAVSQSYFNQAAFTVEDAAMSKKLEGYMKAMVSCKNFHGSVLVAKGGKVLLDKGFGMADYERKIANTSRTKFAIGSLTKAFTAMGIMQLQEKGLLNVNDKLSKYIKNYPQGNEITLHNLLTHTSGIYNFDNDVEMLIKNYKKYEKIDNIIELLKTKKLNFKPGSKYEYCNAGYILLEAIIEKVSRMSYQGYLQKNIFGPLGMKDTGVCYQGKNKCYDSKGYSGFLNLKYMAEDEPVIRVVGGAGNLFSTVEDMYRWDRALKTNKLVSKKTMDKIFTGYSNAGQGAKYGYGWGVISNSLGKVETHSGATLSFSSEITRYVDKDMTIIILTNSADYDTAELSHTLEAVMLNHKYEMPKSRSILSKPIDVKILNGYAGKYKVSEGVYAIVSRKGSDIYIQLPGEAADKLYPESITKFYFYEEDADVEFLKDKKTNAAYLLISQSGDQVKAMKVN